VRASTGFVLCPIEQYESYLVDALASFASFNALRTAPGVTKSRSAICRTVALPGFNFIKPAKVACELGFWASPALVLRWIRHARQDTSAGLAAEGLIISTVPHSAFRFQETKTPARLTSGRFLRSRGRNAVRCPFRCGGHTCLGAMVILIHVRRLRFAWHYGAALWALEQSHHADILGNTIFGEP
jgi:hypothetical protein